MKTLGAIILAAGSSRRMPGINKMLAMYRGKPLLTHCLETIRGLGLGHVVVVAGADFEKIREIAAPFGFETIRNERHANGMGLSIGYGIRALPDTIEGAFICLGDMPLVICGTYRQLAEKYYAGKAEGAEEFDMFAPVYSDRRGHPVLFDRRVFGQLEHLPFDRGARDLIGNSGKRVMLVPVDDGGVVLDIDMPQDLADGSRERPV